MLLERMFHGETFHASRPVLSKTPCSKIKRKINRSKPQGKVFGYRAFDGLVVGVSSGVCAEVYTWNDAGIKSPNRNLAI